MRAHLLTSLIFGCAMSCGHCESTGDIVKTIPGEVRFGLPYDREALYVRHLDMTNDHGKPTVRLPLADTLRAEIYVVNGYDSDIMLKVAPETEILPMEIDARYWYGDRESPRFEKTRSSSSGPFAHHRTYESLKGVGSERPPIGSNLFACCCMAKTFIWERKLGETDAASRRLADLRRVEFMIPIHLNYIVIGRTNVYETETELRIIAEKEQPTSASSEPSQSSGR